VLYENNGYMVFSINTGSESVDVAGMVGEVHIGEIVKLEGRFETHHTHGRQFKVTTCVPYAPQKMHDIEAYLDSGALPNTGPSMTKKIIAMFGSNALNIIAKHPKQLTAVPGLNEEKANAMHQEFRRQFGAQEVVTWLGKYGISAPRAMEVYRAYGPHTLQALTENPYLLCGEPLHLRFAQVDEMAAGLQLPQESRLRIREALLYVMQEKVQEGHTCLPLAELVNDTSNLVNTTSYFIKIGQDKVQEELYMAVKDRKLHWYDLAGSEYVYLPDLYSAEEDIAFRLADLTKYPAPQPKDLERNIDALERVQGFAYAPLQRQAIRQALTSNVLVLTGGPGTGKTTTVNAILKLFENQAKRVALCAPTGRAAKRLAELTGREASTIHRLLEMDCNQGTECFIHSGKDLLKCDVVILDEMSMVDVKLFQSLLRILKHDCRIIMVGDENQLPSVGPGNILGEVIRSGVVPTVCLTENFRQARKSLIDSNAHCIVGGQMPKSGEINDNFFFIKSTGQECQQLICELVATRLPNAYPWDPVRDIQVLCPTKKGPSGTDELNPLLQKTLNPPDARKPEIMNGATVFRQGDKVMQVRNNYNIPFERDGGEAGKGAYNGEIGVVIEVDTAQHTLKVQMNGRKLLYKAEYLSELEIAYAITVHKSQGSEFTAVVMPVIEVPEKLCYRNLLYTGLTRARKLCVMLGQSDTVVAMVRNVSQINRYSGLGELLRSAVRIKPPRAPAGFYLSGGTGVGRNQTT